MTIKLERIAKRKGWANEWECTAPGYTPGFGRTRTEAQGNFFSANYARFGVTRQIDRDYESATVQVVWRG